MAAAHSTQSSTPAQVAGVVSFYMSAALVMVFVNKAVLNSSPDLPLLFLFLQMLLAVLLLHASALLFPAHIDLPRLDAHAARKLAPVVLVNIVGLIFNTLCLRGVDASFFQIARGMVLPMTIAASSLATHSRPSPRVLAAAAIVTLGFLLGVSPASLLPTAISSVTPQATSAPAANVSLLSLLYGLLSSLFIALHSVLIKSSLPHCSGSTIHLAYWTNLGSALFVAPFVVLTGEPQRVLDLLRANAAIGAGSAVELWNVRVFVVGSLVTGIFGFLLCVAGLLSIKITSPITHMFSSAARSVFQTLLGVWLFSDILTVNRATSILVILLGTMYYTWAKHVESQQSKSSSSTSTSTSSSTGGHSASSSLSKSLLPQHKGDLDVGMTEVKPRLSGAEEEEDDEAQEVLFDLESVSPTRSPAGASSPREFGMERMHMHAERVPPSPREKGRLD